MRVNKHTPKLSRRIKPEDLPNWGISNTYDRFNLDFLQKEGSKVMNGEFDVTNTPERLYGVPTGTEEINLIDYLVNRPVPIKLLKWRDIPNIHPDSLDMENWYSDLIEYCINGA